MPNDRPLFQTHHALEQQAFGRDPLLQVLVDSGHLSKDATTNLIHLPNDKVLAQALGVTPHTGGPIKDYRLGLKDALEDLASTKDGLAALQGDPDALDRVAQKVQRLSDTAQVALINGELRTNTALGESIDQTRKVTRDFLQTRTTTPPKTLRSWAHTSSPAPMRASGAWSRTTKVASSRPWSTSIVQGSRCLGAAT